MEIEEIRALMQRGAFSVTDHALTEGFKDGITVADMVWAVMTGRIIERYPKRQRFLVFGRNANGLPIHVVVEFRAGQAVDFVTTYIPKRDQWIKGQARKRRKR